MAIRFSPGNCCCGTSCDIGSGGPECVVALTDYDLGTSQNDSLLQIDLDNARTVQPLDWSGDDWSTWTVGDDITGTDDWQFSSVRIRDVAGKKFLGSQAVNGVYRAQRTVEEMGEWTYEWFTDNESSSVKFYVNNVLQETHSEVGVGYNTETVMLRRGDLLKWEVKSVGDIDDARVGEITAAACPQSEHPGRNGDTIDLEIGLETLTFGFEDINREYVPEDLTGCDPITEITYFTRRFYVTDGTRKMIIEDVTYGYPNENRADMDDRITPMDFPAIKFRSGFVEIASCINPLSNCAETLDGAYSYADTEPFGGNGTWIPYEIDHDGEDLTLVCDEDIRIDAWTHYKLEQQCDCCGAIVNEDCTINYTCQVVEPHVVVPYTHSLTLPGLTQGTLQVTRFNNCASESFWGVREFVTPDPIFYTVDTYSVTSSYQEFPIYEAYQFDSLDVTGGGCAEGGGVVCTKVETGFCEQDVCSGYLPPSESQLTSITNFPQDGKWICSLGSFLSLDSLECGLTDLCPDSSHTRITQTYYAGCISDLCPGWAESGCDVDDKLCENTISAPSIDCDEVEFSSVSGSWTPTENVQAAKTWVSSELDNEFTGTDIPDAATYVKGDRVHCASLDVLAGGGVWELNASSEWIFKDQQWIPELPANPYPSAAFTDDFVPLLVNADTDFHYRVNEGVPWGGSPPVYTGDDFSSYSTGVLDGQVGQPYTIGPSAVLGIKIFAGEKVGSERTFVYSSSEYFEIEAEKDCVVSFDYELTNSGAGESVEFFVDGVSQWSESSVGTGTSPEFRVAAGETMRFGFSTGPAGAGNGVYISAIDVRSPIDQYYKLAPDASIPVEVNDDPHPWTRPEVEYGIAGTVVVEWPDTDQLEYSGILNHSDTCTFDCHDTLPPGVTDPEDPTICGSWTQTQIYGGSPSTTPPTAEDDHGPWSGVLATKCTNPSYNLTLDSPPPGYEWFTAQTVTPVSVTLWDPNGPSDIYCEPAEQACKNGYTTNDCTVYTYEASGLWDRECDLYSDVRLHTWATRVYDVWGVIDWASCEVRFPYKWADCWDVFNGPTVSWIGTERVDPGQGCDRLASFTVTDTGKTEFPVSSGIYYPSASTTITRSPIDLDGISLTATPLTSMP